MIEPRVTMGISGSKTDPAYKNAPQGLESTDHNAYSARLVETHEILTPCVPLASMTGSCALTKHVVLPVGTSGIRQMTTYAKNVSVLEQLAIASKKIFAMNVLQGFRDSTLTRKQAHVIDLIRKALSYRQLEQESL